METSTSDNTTEALRARFESLLDESSSDDEERPNIAGPRVTQTNKKKTPPPSKAQNKTQRSVDSEDDPDEVILSMVWMKGSLGAAYYNVMTSELFVMYDAIEDSSHEITKALYRQCEPRNVVTTSAVAENFLDVLKKLVLTELSRDEQEEGDSTSVASSSTSDRVRVSLKILPKKEHDYELCLNRVLYLKLSSEPENATSSDRMTYLNSLLNFESRLVIHALGLLLKYVDVHWNDLTLDPTGQPTFVHISYILLENLVMVDEEIYEELAIIQSRFHPSLFKFGNIASNDHDRSLFTLLHHCNSRPGVRYLWKLLKHPTRDPEILEKRFEAIEYFVDPKNQALVATLKGNLSRVYRLKSSVLNRYSAPVDRIVDWTKFQKTLSQIIYIGDICEEHRNDISLFGKIADGVTSEMRVVKYFVDYVIDFEFSRIQKKLVIKSGVDPKLDELNNTRDKLPQLLSEAGEKDMRKYSLIMEKCVMIYVPSIGHVLAITEGGPSERTGGENEEASLGLEFKFSINGVRHYKSDGARELDETIGDILERINKRQAQIILRLVKYMSRHMGAILSCIELCAELDTLLSLATVARNHNYVRPKMVAEKRIEIKGGRHPLKEHFVSFVANDTRSGGDDSSVVKILTGPNACGKSIYLRQIALIVFMAHIGSFVPAESATIGIISHIFAHIGRDESLAQNVSTFLLSLRRINVALYASTPSSLLIIDEFGAGTSEIDGLALLTSVLMSFIERGILCPHIFAATHIHRVVELLNQSPMIEAQTFEYLSNDTQDLVFLYRLTSGQTTYSFAHSVARNAGLDKDVVERALEVFEARKRGKLPIPLDNYNRGNTVRHIMELLTAPNRPINLEELTLWVRQAMAKPAYK